MNCSDSSIFWWHRPKLYVQVIAFFQDRMQTLLDSTRRFSLVLLRAVGSESLPGDLQDDGFWSAQEKSSVNCGSKFPRSPITTHSLSIGSTRRMPFTEEKNTTTTSDTSPVQYRIHAPKNVPAKSHPKLFSTTSATVKILSYYRELEPS
jgi:hypothetical protein